MNFWRIYRRQATIWFLFYNSSDMFEQVAFGDGKGYDITNDKLFAAFLEGIDDEPEEA